MAYYDITLDIKLNEMSSVRFQNGRCVCLIIDKDLHSIYK